MMAKSKENPTAMTGLVSEAFRKRNKFVTDQMIRVNPQLRAMTGSHTPRLNSSLQDEVMSEGPQSDQMTISSPVSSSNLGRSEEGFSSATSQVDQRQLRKAINGDIVKNLKHMT